MCRAVFQASTKADTITPTTTAIARSVTTVTADTMTMTTASDSGTLRMIRKLDQENVPTTTTNITPTNAAMGICSINDDANSINSSRNTAARMPDKRIRAPDFMLIMLCPIMAQPPMPPKNPVTTLAKPWDIHSRFFCPLVSVMPSINERVSKDSINPIPAKMKAKGRTILAVSKFNGTSGTENSGRPPEMLARSPTVGVSIPPKITAADTTTIPASAAGMRFDTLGTR